MPADPGHPASLSEERTRGAWWSPGLGEDEELVDAASLIEPEE
jgi:hypothetical protein